MTVYAMCKPPRAGLGNKLIAWARSLVYAQQHGLERISTPFAQFSLGPTLRGEKDARLYAGQFCRDPEAISGVQAMFYKAHLARRAEPAAMSDPPAAASGVVEFTSLNGNFTTPAEHNALIRQGLLRITRTPSHRLDALPTISIQVHRGYFGTRNTVGCATFGGCVQTPLAWYRNMLRGLRQHVGADLGAFVVSDGRDYELAELFNEPDVSRVDRGCTIADLCALSQAPGETCIRGKHFHQLGKLFRRFAVNAGAGAKLGMARLSSSSRRLARHCGSGKSLGVRCFPRRRAPRGRRFPHLIALGTV